MPNNSSVPAWAFRIPNSLGADLEDFHRVVEEFKSGAISEAQFRAFRVPMGVYEQREPGRYMLRVRFPAGGVLPHQLRCLAEVAQLHGNRVLHVTTRQDIQVHRVLLESIHPALVALRHAGLATKGGGGNTVRNITACCQSGVCRDEVFEVAPSAIALTERLMTDPLSFQLPRKYKIAFSGCGDDCAGASVNDLGFIARQKDGAAGFAVYVGGGMGGKSRVADLLHDFIPADDVFIVAEAVKRVFDQYGDRKNKHSARLRFLIERVGLSRFRELYEKEKTTLRPSISTPFQTRPQEHPERIERGKRCRATSVASEAYSRWVRSHVFPQKQDGFLRVELPLPLGDLDAGKMVALADMIETHGVGGIWTTPAQNLELRWISPDELPTLYAELYALSLADAQPPILRHMVACAGASTCRLGICLSRGLAKAVQTRLSRSNLELDKLGNLKIHISGCPNSCGRHLVADIGLYGAARRVDGRLVPHYGVQVGGRVSGGAARFGSSCGAIPAKSVPGFLQDLLTAFQQSPEAPDFHHFVGHHGLKLAQELATHYSAVPSYNVDPSFYVDWDATVPFSLAGRGPGECSAGVFDQIEVDLASAREALGAGRLYAATALAARSLLITRGEQPKNDAEAFELFQKLFVSEGLVDRGLERLITAGVRCAFNPHPEQNFKVTPSEVTTLVESVRLLYENMDASLRFKPVAEVKSSATPAGAATAATHDFRGVACPLNYVKTKMALGKLQQGQELLVLLDEPGAKNVPASATKDGHTVVSVSQNTDYWQVLIRKG